MIKNEEIIVKIEDISDTGEGIGHVNGMTLFVKDAILGDTVKAGITKAKKTYAFARTIEIIEASPYRVEPFCAVSRPCGGCQIQSLSYEKQLEFKTEKVKACLERIGGFKVRKSGEVAGECAEDEVMLNDCLGMDKPVAYRNKAQFPFGTDKEGRVILGFYAGRTHSVIETGECGITFAGHREIMDAVLEYVSEARESVYNENTGKGTLRHLFMRKGYKTGEIMVMLVINGGSIARPELLVEKVSKLSGVKSILLNINKANTNVILGDKIKVLYGSETITDYIGDVKYQISPLSFYQVNPAQTEVLYGKALECAGLTGNEVVWDLYCGIGTISLFLAKKAKKVYGVEIVPAAVENAKANAKLNNITNAEFFCGDAAEVYKDKKCPADVVVVDPPRKGLDDSLIRDVCEMAPKKIVYVSCDPATLARDLKLFSELGYRVLSATPTDMFPHSVHVETVCLLSNRKADAKIRIDVDLEDYYAIKDAKKSQN